MSNATRVRGVPMLFLPPSARNHRSNRRAWCHWCCARGTKGRLFKLRDGPTDWFFCDTFHAELWLEYRHAPETYQLCRMLPRERRARLGGRTMSAEISRLFPDRCDQSQP